jgi:hypothetical protein
MKIFRDLSLAIRFLTIIPVILFPPSNNTNQNDEVLAENFANSMSCRYDSRNITGAFKTDILLPRCFFIGR